MDRDDRGVPNARQELGFPNEPLGGHRRCELHPQDLDGHGAVEGPVPAQEDDTHAPAAELALDVVLVGQGRPDPLQQSAHGAPSLGR